MSEVITTVDIEKNYFELFGFSIDFAIDLAELKQRYRVLQQQVHPDQQQFGLTQQKTSAEQLSAKINAAYNTLSNPLRRALYLLELRGRTINKITEKLPTDFLFQQMQLREELETIGKAENPLPMLNAFQQQVADECERLQLDFTKCLDEGDYHAARQVVRQWQFYHKLLDEAEELEFTLQANN